MHWLNNRPMFLTKLTAFCALAFLVLTGISCNSTNAASIDSFAADSQTGIIASFAGQPLTTYGWADMANNGSGMIYQNAESLLIIDDAAYPDPIEKRKAFTNAASAGKSFIILSGDIDLSDGKISDEDKSYFDEFYEATGKRMHEDILYQIGSNTTIFGIDNARIMFGGMQIKDKSNIIIRNITFYDAHGSTEVDTEKDPDSKAGIDALGIEGSSSNIWVDHCTFTDGKCNDMIRNYNHDGAFDIKQGKNITVSYCEFTNHDKVMLIAPNDRYTAAKDRQITLHHNYYHVTTQRMPRSRGCEMHIYNNYYNEIGVPGNNGYSLGPGIGSQFIVENNNFGSHRSSIVKYYDSSAEGSATFSRFYHSGNTPELTAGIGNHLIDTKPWEIPYQYELEAAAGLNISVPENAGSGRIVNADGSLK
jgi:pectate lyase